MAARALASGTICFGLVSVPVKLYTATRSQSLGYNLLHAKDKSRLRQQYLCTTCGEVVERDDMVKGYQYTKDQYVILTQTELDGLEQESDQSIEIEEFIPIDSIDPIYFAKGYFLGPDKGGHKPYRLLCEAMARAGRGAIGKFSTRGKQELVLLRQAQGGLMLHTLFYADEVSSFAEIDRGEGLAVKDGEVDLAVQLIERLASSAFEATKYEDEYRKKAQEVIDRKIAGQETVAAAPRAPRAHIIDLMEALKASLETKPRRAAAPAASAEAHKPLRAKGKMPPPRRAMARAK